jgi:leucyl-tRNA synthetase
MFMGPFDQAVSWSMDGIVGPRRFLEKVWRLQYKVVPKLPFVAALESEIHKAIKKVSEDIESMSFNTAVSALMILSNEMDKQEKLAKTYYEHFLKLLAPFAPHITDEIWANLGYKKSIHLEPWQKPMLSKIQQSTVIVVQVNGKVRGELKVEGNITEQEAKDMALGKAEIAKWIEGKEVRRVIFVPGKLINIVVG